MGDMPSDSSPSDDQKSLESQFTKAEPDPAVRASLPKPAGYSTPSQVQHATDAPAQEHAFHSQFDMTSLPAPSGQQGLYNMTALNSALPHEQYRVGRQHDGFAHHYHPGSPPLPAPQMSPTAHYHGGSPPMGGPVPGYYMQQPQMHSYYYPDNSVAARGQPNLPAQPGIPYYANHALPHPTPQSYYPHHVPQTGQAQFFPSQRISNHSSTGGNLNVMSSQDPRQYQPRGPRSSEVKTDQARRQSIVRGPPRKPRQSGYAVWIGNLPLQTDLMNLVHHVYTEAQGLVSLFLISKSNCAFANFKDEQACVTAQHVLHDSRFQSVRLVCRLRNTVDSSAGSSVSTKTVPNPETGSDDAGRSSPATRNNASPVVGHPQASRTGFISDSVPQRDRFFILKSLTVEDLELSVRTGIWATQSHNEDTLTKAFQSADNVYLIFSANKSGEYFGYARMTSRINEDPAAAIQFAPQAHTTTDTDLPKATIVEETKEVPRGRVVDDSARGTIFWEIDGDDSDDDSDNGGNSEITGSKSPVTNDDMQTWGKPFNLEWLSNGPLPFYRTRGLRNPWNSNREVKIARDGTELEPSVGRRLIGLFNRAPMPDQMAPALPIYTHLPLPYR